MPFPFISRRLMSSKTISNKASQRVCFLDPGGTVFAEFTALAIQHQAVNLGQGFPTLPVPEFIREAAKKAVSDPCLVHQYTRSEGNKSLCESLSRYYESSLNRKINPMTEIVTTVGASEAIYSAIQAFVNPGDEVIMMQPFYDSYPASVLLAGGKPVIVSLKPPQGRPADSAADWTFDEQEIQSKITSKTKIIMVNNPHNPIGKVFTKKELLTIARIAEAHDLLVIADEVYESLVYSDAPESYIKFASLPGMFDRTITIGSVGKMLGVTGWKIGWVISSPEIVKSTWMVHQWIPFTVVTPLQEAAAVSIDQAMKNGYFEKTRKEYQNLRDKLTMMLRKAGLNPTVPHGGYFTLADTSKIKETSDTSSTNDQRRDYRICRQLTREVGVTAIPPSAFYDPEDLDSRQNIAGKLARFAFCKNENMLNDAQKRLEKYLS